MDLQLAGKRAVVTGASRGIGKAIARQLAREGADVVLAARGLDALTKNLADELGPQGITVNAIHPGATRTEKTTAEAAERAGRAVTIGRIVEAEEIAVLAAFLASPLSAALNGQNLQAGGGAPGVIDD